VIGTLLELLVGHVEGVYGGVVLALEPVAPAQLDVLELHAEHAVAGAIHIARGMRGVEQLHHLLASVCLRYEREERLAGAVGVVTAHLVQLGR
jgi:hypothetical protein